MDINIKGYDIVALIACDYGHVVVLNNNSTHFLVVDAESVESDYSDEIYRLHLNPEAKRMGSFEYGTDRGWPSAREAMRSALQFATNRAMMNVEE